MRPVFFFVSFLSIYSLVEIAIEDPWSPQPPVRTAASANDPWSPAAGATALDVDDFDLLTNRAQAASPMGRSNGSRSPFDLTGMDSALTAQYSDNSSGGAKPKKSPESFLGPNSNLVNLENLVKSYHVIMRHFCPFISDSCCVSFFDFCFSLFFFSFKLSRFYFCLLFLILVFFFFFK